MLVPIESDPDRLVRGEGKSVLGDFLAIGQKLKAVVTEAEKEGY
jgi:hypothetical protein